MSILFFGDFEIFMTAVKYLRVAYYYLKTVESFNAHKMDDLTRERKLIDF